MSAHWHPGMEVECIDAAGAPDLVIGEKYTIYALVGPYNCTWRGRIRFTVGLLLKGARPLPGDIGFAPERFRPIQKRKIDISVFTALLNPTEADEFSLLEAEEFGHELEEEPFR